ncbi:MAG: hypothetical protein G01um101438_598 [Parcubacteria group bacterium Gr01-1014_38]|nr:MAG: hypothetical protein G01um101438_598 [Parcubacteria group bacterium Gr01-1014_38]
MTCDRVRLEQGEGRSTLSLRVSVVLTVLLFAHPAFAHELLPIQVQEFLRANPTASPEDLRKILGAHTAPDLAKRIRNAEDVVRLAHQQTTLLDNSMDFGKLGVRHILGGLDHVLFVLSLLLVPASLRRILRLTSTFTIAHSLSLLLAGAGLLTLSSRIVEPFIAFSIAYVALTSTFLHHVRWFRSTLSHIVTVFVFGFFHGLGFAGILKEIQLPQDKFLSSLFSFNVGIELGQLLVVSLALSVLWSARTSTWYQAFLKLAGVVLGGLGLAWGIQRMVA